MAELLTAIIVSLVLNLAAYALMPKPKPPKPPAIGQADLPSADEGVPIPVLFGTVLIKQSCVLTAFGHRTTPIRKKG